PRYLGAEAQRDALVRLDADREDVRLQRGAVELCRAEEQMRHAPELDSKLGHALRQALAGTQKERYAGPAPVLHLQPQGHVRLGQRGRSHAWLLAIARHRPLAGDPRAVLAAHSLLEHLV